MLEPGLWTSQDRGRAVRGIPSFGARAAVAKDNIYWFGTRGLIFTSPWVLTASTERQPAVLLLTASGRPVEVSARGTASRHRAFAVAPLTRRGLHAVDVGLVSVNIQPHHPCYPAFCRIAPPGVRPLPREAFAKFDADLVRTYEGRISNRAAEVLFEDLVAAATELLAVTRQRDERFEILLALLRDHPDCSLEEVARLLGVSYTAASHLFGRAVGIPLRTYQHWIKCMRATDYFSGEKTLTEIAQLAGFSDSAHLSRAWQRRYGLTPSYLRDNRHVRVYD